MCSEMLNNCLSIGDGENKETTFKINVRLERKGKKKKKGSKRYILINIRNKPEDGLFRYYRVLLIIVSKLLQI